MRCWMRSCRNGQNSKQQKDHHTGGLFICFDCFDYSKDKRYLLAMWIKILQWCCLALLAQNSPQDYFNRSEKYWQKLTYSSLNQTTEMEK